MRAASTARRQKPGTTCRPTRSGRSSVLRIARAGFIDDDEPERALVERRPREEEAQRGGMELSLAHQAERRCWNAVDGHVKRHLPRRPGALQLDPTELNVA